MKVSSSADAKKEIQIADKINASQSSSNRHISTSTVHWRPCESGLHGRIAAKKHTNKKKRSVLWSDDSKFEIVGSNCHVRVRRIVGERMMSIFMVPTVKHGGGGVMVLCW